MPGAIMKTSSYLKNSIKTALFAAAVFSAAGQIRANEPLAEVPFEYELDKIIVPVEVNGKKTVRLVLDTGMPEGVFLTRKGSAEGMDLNYLAADVRVGGAGSHVSTAKLATGAVLGLAGFEFADQRVIVLNQEGTLSKRDWDGVIGASIFNRFAVEIDVTRKMIRLYEPGRFDVSRAGEEFELTITKTKPYFSATVNVDGRKDVPIKMVVDTGAGEGMMLSVKEGGPFAVPAGALGATYGGGIGGDHGGSFARVKELRLGKQVLTEIVTMFNTGKMPVEGSEGILGMKVMERFVVTFDYQNKRMFLKPTDRMNDRFEFDLLGFYARPGEGGELTVVDVFQGSSAAKAGIRKGDVITGVDGKRVGYSEWLSIVESVNEPGKKLRITWSREGKEYSADIVSKRII